MIRFYSQTSGEHDESRHLFKAAGYKEVHDPSDADLIVFNGGRDIGTEIYGENPIDRGIPRFKSYRDTLEINLYNHFKKSGKVILGICRGAQLINCLNGGTLWQDVDGHHWDHQMIDLLTGKIYGVTSTHHQMMRPAPGALIIGVSSEAHVKRADNLVETFKVVNDLKQGQDVEICWYEDTKSLCVQGHPEYVPGSDFANYVLNMIEERLAA